jgi:hypothetical protein
VNTYTALKAFNGHVTGDKFTAPDEIGAKLIRQGLASLTTEYDNEQVQLRWKNENLEVYNRLTGAVLLRIPKTGLTSLTVDIIGDVTGDVTGNVTGNLAGNVTGVLTGNVTGDVTGDVDGNVTGQLFGDVTTYVGDGEIGLNLLMAILNGNTATCAMTLADGTEGQTITIKTIDITNTCTVTPTHLAGGTSISLPAVGDAVTLMFDGTTDWHVLNLYGTAAVVA